MALKESKKLEQANSYELVVTVDGETFEKALNTVYKKEVKKINIPGFRKGKAPRHIIEKMYGKEVFYDDAMQDCYPEALYNAAEEAGVKIVAVESIEVTEVENGFTFKANIVVEPDMEINNYLGFEVTKKSTEVTDELIDEEIEKVRDRNSRMVTVEDRPVANGDIAVIDFEGFVDDVAFEGGKGEDYELEIGSGTFIPGFEEQLVGAETDADVDVKVTFPEEYHEKKLAGQPAVFKCKVNEIRAKVLPELTDEFAQKVGPFKTVDDLKADIQKYLDTQKADIDRTNSEKAIFEKVTGDAKVEIQQSMIDREADQLAEEYKQKLSMQGFSWDQAVEAQGYDNIMNSLKEDAAMRVKNSLVIDKIAKEENLVVSQAEFGAKLSEIGRMYQMDTPTMIKQLSQTPGVFNAISQQALNEKVTQFLAENNTVKFK